MIDKLQLIDFLQSDDLKLIIGWENTELQESFGEDFAIMQGYKQNNPHHCYDLLEHTLRTTENLDCEGLSEEDFICLKTAALFHDIGKPKVVVKKPGRNVYYNHANASEKIARKILIQMGFEKQEMERICFLIQRHDDFVSFRPKKTVEATGNSHLKAITLKNVYERIYKVRRWSMRKGGYVASFEDFSLLLRLCVADARAQRPVVVRKGIEVDSIEKKVKRLELIGDFIDMIRNADSESCDLHMHSIYSDGTDEPDEILKKADEIQLRAIALTDHNTIDGLDDFLANSKRYQVDVLPGVEFSTQLGKTELHVLGFFCDTKQYNRVKQTVEEARSVKEKSNRQFLSNLKRAGYAVDYKELRASCPKGNINRAVIATYLVEKGIINSVQEGFQTILSKKRGYYVSPKRITTIDTVKLIKKVGGVAILAHPLIDLSAEELEKIIPQLKAAGLDGIEVYYSSYNSTTHETAKRIARKYHLIMGGGSDYHGDTKLQIRMGTGRGGLRIPLTVYLRLLERTM